MHIHTYIHVHMYMCTDIHMFLHRNSTWYINLCTCNTFTHTCVQIDTVTHMQLYVCSLSIVLYFPNVSVLLSVFVSLEHVMNSNISKVLHVYMHICIHKNTTKESKQVTKYMATFCCQQDLSQSKACHPLNTHTCWHQYVWYWTFIFLSCRER